MTPRVPRRALAGCLVALGAILGAMFLFGALVVIPFDEVTEGPKPLYRAVTSCLSALCFLGAAALGGWLWRAGRPGRMGAP
jgi:hypothetical protein